MTEAINREQVRKILHHALDIAFDEIVALRLERDYSAVQQMLVNLGAMPFRPAKHGILPEQREDSADAAARGLFALSERIFADIKALRERVERDQHNGGAMWRDLTPAERSAAYDVTDFARSLTAMVRAYEEKFAPSAERKSS